LEEGAGRIDFVPVLMLLDRRPDVFLAKRSEADGWLLKPLDPIRTRKAVHARVVVGEGRVDLFVEPIGVGGEQDQGHVGRG
jgi:hypothetical protein